MSDKNRHTDKYSKGRSRGKAGKCDVRLDKQELEMLRYLAELNEVTHSDIMRRALKDYYKFNTEGGVEV